MVVLNTTIFQYDVLVVKTMTKKIESDSVLDN
jgi:hypothetical protein